MTGLIQWGTTPVAGITLEIKPGDLFGANARPAAAVVTSDAQGRYRAAGLAAGMYTLYAVRVGTAYIGSTIPTVDVVSGAETAVPAVYMVKPFALLGPAQDAFVAAPVTLSWELVAAATQYEVYVTEIGSTCTSATGAAPRPTVVTGTSVAVATLVSGKHYWWTVKAKVGENDVAWYTGAPRCIWVK